MKYKIIFLDVDGVLNSSTFFRDMKEIGKFRTDLWNLNPNSIALLRVLIAEDPTIRLVLSSTWRLYPDGIKALHEAGLDFIASTVDYHGAKCRGEEILRWVIDNEDDIFSYVILDDQDDMLPQQYKRFVRTSMRDGLLPVHLEKAKRILCCPMNSPVVF